MEVKKSTLVEKFYPEQSIHMKLQFLKFCVLFRQHSLYVVFGQTLFQHYSNFLKQILITISIPIRENIQCKCYNIITFEQNKSCIYLTKSYLVYITKYSQNKSLIKN
ncbi:hypothetical protein IMG5_097250 [Ichthyophthirius multifiliis]|uniref:Uncharacterized protein n=1 Tax=Ichthyophthirius multifiliis TaxID=5932 RepID=G0QRS5_ICHMU|nr:hypothetical protein IMG5_097250 [Ichthyophthirius multifiliis]EGR32059.1 hypothetical protein IMG5_097250 [Ichthyophthirius multifiliis]|eukprot:XP_004035545.1 hypothetical protein IMG5_097250 [Ichthyophthirius multifiliis]